MEHRFDYGRRKSDAGDVPRSVLSVRSADEPADFLGQAEVEKQNGSDFPPVFVTWNVSDTWTPGCGALWYSPKALGIRDVAEVDGRVYVPIASFLWVLDPERLCQPVTGENYGAYKADANNTASAVGQQKLARFYDHQQLAQFLEGQLKMFARMCMGRSYNCIRHLSSSFSYITLITLCENALLPGGFRAACCDLLRILYLDRYPQLRDCGRPGLPELLWVYEVVRKDVDIRGMPVLRDLHLNDDTALPQFKISASHPLHGDKDVLMSFPTATKFYLARKLTGAFLQDFGGKNCTVVASKKEQNLLLVAMMRVVADLISFGFSELGEGSVWRRQGEAAC